MRNPSDPRARFCLANVGRPIRITYHGKRRTIVPLRVFTKPAFRKTYVLAKERGWLFSKRKHFNVDEMTLVGQQD
jgi:hypothetical protein